MNSIRCPAARIGFGKWLRGHFCVADFVRCTLPPVHRGKQNASRRDKAARRQRHPGCGARAPLTTWKSPQMSNSATPPTVHYRAVRSGERGAPGTADQPRPTGWPATRPRPQGAWRRERGAGTRSAAERSRSLAKGRPALRERVGNCRATVFKFLVMQAHPA
jgi:hypothetical protein